MIPPERAPGDHWAGERSLAPRRHLLPVLQKRPCRAAFFFSFDHQVLAGATAPLLGDVGAGRRSAAAHSWDAIRSGGFDRASCY